MELIQPVDFSKIKHGRNVRIYLPVVLFPNVELGNDVTIFPGAVIGRPSLSSGATTRQVAGEPKPVRIGDGCIIMSNAVIYHDVEIGPKTMVCDTACIREGVRIGERCVIAMGVTINYNTRIGNRVKVMDNSHLTGNMVIEDDVFIAMLVTTANDNTMGRKKTQGTDWLEKGPTIKRFARIGHGTCIHPNVTIGEDSLVGANSVVSKDVPPRTFVAGSPAHIIRALSKSELHNA